MSVDHDPNAHVPTPNAKTSLFLNKLKSVIGKGPSKKKEQEYTHERSELKNVIRRIRGQLDILDDTIDCTEEEGLNKVADRACHDIRELLHELQNATGAQGDQWGGITFPINYHSIAPNSRWPSEPRRGGV